MAAPMHRPGLPSLPRVPPTEPVARPPEKGTALPPPAPPPSTNRAWAAVVVAWTGVIVATVTVFAPWASYVDGVELTGVEHGDGWFVLAVAIASAGLVGALAFGWRHATIRIGLLASSALLLLLFTLNRIDISRSEDRVTQGPIDVGGGLYGVAVAACLVLAGALIIPPQSSNNPRA